MRFARMVRSALFTSDIEHVLTLDPDVAVRTSHEGHVHCYESASVHTALTTMCVKQYYRDDGSLYYASHSGSMQLIQGFYVAPDACARSSVQTAMELVAVILYPSRQLVSDSRIYSLQFRTGT